MPDLYYFLMCPPCRSVLLVAKALNLELNLKVIDLVKEEHKTPEYLKKNPQRTVPALEDDGLIIAESRAIITYLVTQYGKDDSLYPKDPKKRAVVDQKLYFDIGTLWQAMFNYFVFPVMSTGKVGGEEYLDKLQKAYNVLNKFLEEQPWVAGNNITIADYSIAVTVSATEALGYDISKYTNVTKWFEKAKKAIAGFKEINEEANTELKAYFERFYK